MIKFFRKIRQNLLSEGKTGAYLKYALGEIVLVVIGILIAIQINNWNNERNEKKVELEYYLNIKEQLSEDIEEIEGNIEYNNLYMSQFKDAIEIIEQKDRSKLDTLIKISLNLTKYSDVKRQSNIYETLVNSGEIKILNNSGIIEEIRELESLYIYINKMEQIHKDVILDNVGVFIGDNFKLLTQEVLDVENIYAVKFQNLFVLMIGIMNEKAVIYNDAIEEIQTIIKLIDDESNLTVKN